MSVNVPYGSSGWKYLNEDDAGIPVDWYSTTFDDSAWSTGQGGFAHSTAPPGLFTTPFTDGISGQPGSEEGQNTDVGAPIVTPPPPLGHDGNLVLRRWIDPGTGILVIYDVQPDYPEVYVNDVLVSSGSTGVHHVRAFTVPDQTEPWLLAIHVTQGNGWGYVGLDVRVTGEDLPPDPDPDPEPEPATVVGGPTIGELGCGDYRVVITNRCGSMPICDITESVTSLDGSPFRVMDDTSQVIVTVDLTGSEGEVCCECLGTTRSWIHSLVIERNGVVVWGPGPIVNLLYKTEQVVVTARDVSAWLDRRVIHNDYVFYQETVSSVVRTLLEDALGVDDPCGLIGYLTIKPTSTLIDKEVVAHEGSAGDVLRDMARNYLDFTVVGQRIIIAEELTYGPFTRLGDDDFQNELEVEERGLEAATKWYVEGDGVEGTCGGTDTYYGLLEQVVTEDTLLDEVTTNAAACGRLKNSNPAPVYINIPDDAQLSAQAHVTFDQLIPGTLVDVAIDDVCRPVYARNRLTSMSIKVASDGTEAVGVTLSPLGTTTGGATTE